MLEIILLTIFPMALSYAAVSDLATMRIPNLLSIMLVIGFFLVSFTVGLPILVILSHLSIGFLILLVTFILFAYGVMGGGDAKLLASTALWFTPVDAFGFLLLSAIYGGALTLIILFFRAHPLPCFFRWEWSSRLYCCCESDMIPYGVAISVAGLQLHPSSVWLHAL